MNKIKGRKRKSSNLQYQILAQLEWQAGKN